MSYANYLMSLRKADPEPAVEPVTPAVKTPEELSQELADLKDMLAMYQSMPQNPATPAPAPTPEPAAPSITDQQKAAYLGMLTGYNPAIFQPAPTAQPNGNPINNPITAPAGNPISNPINTQPSGSFMSAYQAKRDELANKPTVRSLFKEIEQYEQSPR